MKRKLQHVEIGVVFYHCTKDPKERFQLIGPQQDQEEQLVQVINFCLCNTEKCVLNHDADVNEERT